MPEPAPLSIGSTPPIWPPTLPNPQDSSRTVSGPPRVEFTDTLTGPMRSRVVARVAPAQFAFRTWLTPLQMEEFEDWYRATVLPADGEFYASWIGGSRVVAFIEPYQYRMIGLLYELSGRLIRTRIDATVCDAYISLYFTDIYRGTFGSPENYVATLGSSEIYAPTFDLGYIEDHEC